jgi:3-deoxy-manno-octulosonate cytidylyltransferase (CMP-KDO synthetase)
LIQHVAEAVTSVPGIDATVVATDDERIASAAREAGVDVIVSDRQYASGTDRVADVAGQYPAEIVVNVQGDELLLDPDSVAAALESFRGADFRLGTLRAPLTDPSDLWDPNVVKVVVDAEGKALYFSRSPVPFPRHEWQRGLVEASTGVPDEEAMTTLASAVGCEPAAGATWAHLGVYLYRREALELWASLPPSDLERAEGLEQLRVLEAGEAMQTYVVNEIIPGVNTPQDLERARAALAAR